MKTFLVIKFKGLTIRLSAHELVQAAIEVMKSLNANVTSGQYKMAGPNERGPVSPKTIAADPHEWLYQAMLLKQGVIGYERKYAEFMRKEYLFSVYSKMFEYYRSKIAAISDEQIRKDQTLPLWNFIQLELELLIKELPKRKKKEKTKDLDTIVERFIELNKYLSSMPSPNFSDDGDSSEDDYDSTPESPSKKFVELYIQQKGAEIESLQKKQFCYQIKNLLEVLDKQTSKTNIDIDQADEGAYDNLTLEELTTKLCLILEIPLASDVPLVKMGVIISQYLAKAPSFKKVNVKIVCDELKIYISKCDISNKYNEIWSKNYYEKVYHKLFQMSDLYFQYNLISISRLFYDQVIAGQTQVPQCKRFSSIKGFYTQLLEKMLTINYGDDESSKDHRRRKLSITSPGEHLTFLKHLIRQGEVIENPGELATNFLRETKDNDLTQVLQQMDCGDTCRFMGNDAGYASAESLEQPKLEYYQIGEQLIVVENGGSRYAYASGKTSEYGVDIVRRIKSLGKYYAGYYKGNDRCFGEIEKLFGKNSPRDDSLTFSQIDLSDFIIELVRNLYLFRQALYSVGIEFLGRLEIDAERTWFIKNNTDPDEKGILTEITVKLDDLKSKYQSASIIMFQLKMDILRIIEQQVSNFMMDAYSAGHQILKRKLLVEGDKADELVYQKSREKEATYRGIYADIHGLSIQEVASIMRGFLTSTQVLLPMTEIQAKGISILTSAWFIAEVSRNPVSLLSGLMLMDLMENNILYGSSKKSFSLERVLWHPSTIGDTYNNPEDVKRHNQKLSEVEKRDETFPEAEYWGGKHPMCHQGSFTRDVADKAKKWSLGNSLEIIRQKEGTLLIKWLEYTLKMVFGDEIQVSTERLSSVEGKIKTEKAIRPAGKKINSYCISKGPASLTNNIVIESIIKPLMYKRLSSFDNGVKLFQQDDFKSNMRVNFNSLVTYLQSTGDFLSAINVGNSHYTPRFYKPLATGVPGHSENHLTLTITDRSYWYSIHDGICLLRHMRSKLTLLNEEAVDRNHPFRQNTSNIFLADPYHHSNFTSYLNDDIDRITASGDFQFQVPWTQMPTLIVLPILTGAHWQCVRIQFDYENARVKIDWNDPFGNNANYQILLQQYSNSIKHACLRLIQIQNKNTEITLQELQVIEVTDLIDQQGYQKNGSDCGVITFTNIDDYIANRNFTIPAYDSLQHAQIIRQRRMTDASIVGDDAHDNAGISATREKQLELDQVKYLQQRKEKYQSSSNTKIIEIVEKLSPDLVDHFFVYLDIYGELDLAYSAFQYDLSSESTATFGF